MMTASDPRGTDPDWWRRAVVYQVYPRSFADANGDGVGDVAGIRSRLPYLRRLGVDAVWITPWYRSPMADGGYDVADYRAIDPLFGTLTEGEALIADAHALGLRVLLDIVPNHTSSGHPWFREALASPPGSAARGRYWFRDGRGEHGELPPNGWGSVFGGSAWTRVPDGQWYLHLFDPGQPDLDWDNPGVRAEFESILEFWLGRGVDGFRIDVAHFLLKDRHLPDIGAAAQAPGGHPYLDRDGLHDLYRSWRRIADRHGAVFCGEIDLPPDRTARFLRPGELHTAFNFDLVKRPWSAGPLRRSIDRTLASCASVGAPPTWVLGNHDLPRASFRLGRHDEAGVEEVVAWSHNGDSDQVLGLRRQRAAALLTLALPGVAYVYQGEELGLPEVVDLPASVRQDPTFFRTGGAEVGRDGDRVPMPWAGTEAPFGFGPAGSVPWLPQPASWAALTVDAQDADPSSVLSLYRAALAIRRAEPGLRGEAFRWLDAPDDVLHFERGDGIRCVVNLAAAPFPVPDGARVLVRSDGPSASGPILRDGGAWYSTQRLVDGSPSNSDNIGRD